MSTVSEVSWSLASSISIEFTTNFVGARRRRRVETLRKTWLSYTANDVGFLRYRYCTTVVAVGLVLNVPALHIPDDKSLPSCRLWTIQGEPIITAPLCEVHFVLILNNFYFSLWYVKVCDVRLCLHCSSVCATRACPATEAAAVFCC